MARLSHLSIRVSPDEKAELQQLADRQDVSLGKLARKLLMLRDEPLASPCSVVAGGLPPGLRSEEIAWLQKNLARLRVEIPGHWIIVEGDEMVAHGVDYLLTLAEARAKGVSIPFVERVPDRDGAVWMGL
jgi:hypothetical protein